LSLLISNRIPHPTVFHNVGVLLNDLDATIKTIIDRTDGQRLQVDFGKDETALIYLWQVIERIL
jgi:hypothetical protein